MVAITLHVTPARATGAQSTPKTPMRANTANICRTKCFLRYQGRFPGRMVQNPGQKAHRARYRAFGAISRWLVSTGL